MVRRGGWLDQFDEDSAGILRMDEVHLGARGALFGRFVEEAESLGTATAIPT
jgi:hypothetical protein